MMNETSTASTSEPSATMNEAAADKRFPPSVFPVKLHRLLDEASRDKEKSSIVSWSPDGKSFKVHDKERFSSEIMPSYFGPLKFRSFQKNLNMWGFASRRRGECSHVLFLRDSEALLHQMKRQPVVKKAKAVVESHHHHHHPRQQPALPAVARSDTNAVSSDERTSQFLHPHGKIHGEDPVSTKNSFLSAGLSRHNLPTMGQVRRLNPSGSAFALGIKPETDCGTIGATSIAGLTSGISDHSRLLSQDPTSTALSNSRLVELQTALLLGRGRQQAAAAPPSLSPTTLRRKPQDILEEALMVANHQDGQSNDVAARDNVTANPVDHLRHNEERNHSLLLSLLEDQQQRRARVMQQDRSSTQLRTLTNLAILGELQYLSDALLLSGTNANR